MARFTDALPGIRLVPVSVAPETLVPDHVLAISVF
jgi:hypothetical protein